MKYSYGQLVYFKLGPVTKIGGVIGRRIDESGKELYQLSYGKNLSIWTAVIGICPLKKEKEIK